ncbi:hypothetical protein ANN_00640 [Periplaneta americana]|uniref:Tc1-like transposase DDE domain-containing protein n=1 Tax=Periplaneta americana TaxID=6978 RepID=A0ABQ8TSF6_PERAM|nr:hypothetical protein ANN_00640 [Periplaneta americana]
MRQRGAEQRTVSARERAKITVPKERSKASTSFRRPNAGWRRRMEGAALERIPNLSAEQSDGITVFRISTMTSLMLHRCRTGSISLQGWWQYPSANTCGVTVSASGRETSSFVPILLQRDVIDVHRSGEIRNTLIGTSGGAFSKHEYAAKLSVFSRCGFGNAPNLRTGAGHGCALRSVVSRPIPGRPRITTREEDAMLLREVENHPFRTASQLKIASNFPNSPHTMMRRFRERGIRCRRAMRTTFDDGACRGPSSVCYSPTRFLLEKCHFLRRGVLERIHGRFTAKVYEYILANVMIASVREQYPEGTLFVQQDNHPVHTPNRIQRWFTRRRDVDLVDWSPKSPYMNPIENLWAAVKRVLRSNWAEQPPVRTADELWDRVAMNLDLFHNLVDSMLRRMRAVVDAGGLWTRY